MELPPVSTDTHHLQMTKSYFSGQNYRQPLSASDKKKTVDKPRGHSEEWVARALNPLVPAKNKKALGGWVNVLPRGEAAKIYHCKCLTMLTALNSLPQKRNKRCHQNP